jgi:hypothetical protein
MCSSNVVHFGRRFTFDGCGKVCSLSEYCFDKNNFSGKVFWAAAVLGIEDDGLH